MSDDRIMVVTEFAVFALLLVWMFMDRCNIYFRKE